MDLCAMPVSAVVVVVVAVAVAVVVVVEAVVAVAVGEPAVQIEEVDAVVAD